MVQVLSNNAYEAWTAAIRYCNDILSGKCTLQYQKTFVSSLHNAVELYLKQIMLNESQHEVAYIPTKNKSEKAQVLRLRYANSNNLNRFFAEMNSEELQLFKSITFTELIKKVDLPLFQRNDIKEAIDLLQRLRNDETHFLICEKAFLTEDSFCVLHNFMIDFYKLLETWRSKDEKQKYDYWILPYVGDCVDAESQFSFSKQPLEHFSYESAVRSSKLANEIAKILSSDYLHGAPDFSSYSIAREIVQLNPQYNEIFDDIWTYTYMMMTLGIVKVDEQLDNPDECEGIPKVHFNMIISM